MTIDERLEKLAERHQALSESVELLRAAQAETDKRFQEVATLFRETDSFIRTLAQIAKRHDDRLDGHEERLDALDGGGK